MPRAFVAILMPDCIAGVLAKPARSLAKTSRPEPDDREEEPLGGSAIKALIPALPDGLPGRGDPGAVRERMNGVAGIDGGAVCAARRRSWLTPLVVDVGVFLRWFVDQDGFEHGSTLARSMPSCCGAAQSPSGRLKQVGGQL
jgi:hypothetical protein